eukprot:TRINITY_DN574_c0_g3_i1.p1 TRINITY_DN574_c0_g3~~TRINITY_DN574_c0_g3_i1.p1  ORF type:complete len:328 (+),score=66.67 TRINITY_DN574_c0_g3_i1:51-1034(+)
MGEETIVEVGDARNESSGCSGLAVILRCLGASGVLTLGVVSFMDMLTQVLKPHRFSFDAFMVVFCLFSLLGELWTTSCMQGFGYSLLKHTYFITTYSGRGIWYIFIGSCNLDDFSDKPFTVIVGIYLIGLGLVILCLGICMGKSLPQYKHPEHMKKKENKAGLIDPKARKGGNKDGNKNNEEAPITSDQVDTINEDDLDPYEKRLLAEERRKQQESNNTYKIANPFGEGNPYASVASTVVRNGDAPAVARAVVKGDNATAASTVAKSVVLGPQSGGQQQHQPFQQPSQPSSANPYANYSIDDDEDIKKKKGDDDDELERQYAAMFAK